MSPLLWRGTLFDRQDRLHSGKTPPRPLFVLFPTFPTCSIFHLFTLRHHNHSHDNRPVHVDIHLLSPPPAHTYLTSTHQPHVIQLIALNSNHASLHQPRQSACPRGPALSRPSFGNSTRAFGHSGIRPFEHAQNTYHHTHNSPPFYRPAHVGLHSLAPRSVSGTQAFGYSGIRPFETHAIRTATRTMPHAHATRTITLLPFVWPMLLPPPLFPPLDHEPDPLAPLTTLDTRALGHSKRTKSPFSLPPLHTRIRHPFVSVAPALYVLATPAYSLNTSLPRILPYAATSRPAPWQAVPRPPAAIPP